MNRKIFEWSVRFFSENKTAYNILRFVYKVLPLVMFIAYPLLLVYVYFHSLKDLNKLMMVPLWVFVGVTILRVLVNETRPYERYGKPSVFNKDTVGKSFPSRHTASAFVIAMAFLYVNVPIGIAALLIALLIEISRILAGAHYIHDVVAGMAIGVFFGWLLIFAVDIFAVL